MPKSKIKQVKKVVDSDILHNLTNIKKALAQTTEGMKSQAHEMVSDLLEDLQEKRANYQECIEDYVSEEPLKSLGIAVLFGILISKIIL